MIACPNIATADSILSLKVFVPGLRSVHPEVAGSTSPALTERGYGGAYPQRPRTVKRLGRSPGQPRRAERAAAVCQTAVLTNTIGMRGVKAGRISVFCTCVLRPLPLLVILAKDI